MKEDTITNLNKLCEVIKSTKEGRAYLEKIKEDLKPSFLKYLKRE